ncbi:ATP F0F1 synthase subunit beta [Platysternon megacephalum]|uniref:ATP F0F1 synthase subunit beta n=1 Tax=Platysternon megacephalum TaxID=55544 RepID=A0A4D9DHZ0_9SAUR|nr:ATP F0F1 synthase subunit beta [Platysternon megacephalum]
MVLRENEPLAGLSQTSRCPVLAPVGQDRRRGPCPAQGPETARAQLVGNADCLSSGPGGATSDSPEEDEASSTESAQNGDESPQAGAEGSRLRGEQDEVLGRVAELESRIKELQHQQKEMNIEMKLEGALLEGELAAEWREVQREEQLVLQLQRRFAETVHRCHVEREKEKARLGKERRKVEELQRQHAESQTHLETQPESMRERMQSQLQQTSEMLEGALKSYEDLEFQQLERESRLEEEKEEACQALARQVAQVQESLKERKRKVRRLEVQVRSVQEHMAGECRKLAQEKGEAVQSLNLERRRLEELGKACEDESRGDSPVSNQELTKLMFTQKTDRKVVVLGCDQRDPACVFSVRSSVQSSFGLQRSRSLPRRRGDRPAPRPSQRPLSLEANDSDVLALQLSAGGDRRCVPLKHLNAPLYPLGGPYRLLTPHRLSVPLPPQQRELLCHQTGRNGADDKEEAKLKGVIYFQAIEEVYYDHLRSAFKSPNPKLTFCVKTYDRLFCLVAPSAEAMRIWMDAIVTAAEENTRY